MNGLAIICIVAVAGLSMVMTMREAGIESLPLLSALKVFGVALLFSGLLLAAQWALYS